MAIIQKSKEAAGAGEGERSNLSLLQGVRKFALEVKELDIDLIDRINPFDAAYAILAKSMDERTLRQVQVSIAAKRVNIAPDEALTLAQAAARWQREHGRSPKIDAQDPWEKRLAEGATAFLRHRAAGKYPAKKND